MTIMGTIWKFEKDFHPNPQRNLPIPFYLCWHWHSIYFGENQFSKSVEVTPQELNDN